MVDVLVGGKRREDVLRQRKEYLDSRTTEESNLQAHGFSVNEGPTYWDLFNVKLLDGNLYNVRYFKDVHRGDRGNVLELTPNGWKHFAQNGAVLWKGLKRISSRGTQNQPQESANAIPYALPVYFRVWQTLHEHRNDPTYGSRIQQVKGDIKKTLENNAIITLSNIHYGYQGSSDTASHFTADTPWAQVKAHREYLPAQSGLVSTIEPRNQIARLLFCTDHASLEAVTTFLFERQLYFNRAPQTETPTEAVVEIGKSLEVEGPALTAINTIDTHEGPAVLMDITPSKTGEEP